MREGCSDAGQGARPRHREAGADGDDGDDGDVTVTGMGQQTSLLPQPPHSTQPSLTPNI